MNPRSALAGTAALLLASVAVPTATILSTAPAFAQQISAEAQAALNDNTPPASLDRKVLRERIKVLRDAVQSGALKGPQRKAAQDKIKAYREAAQAGGGQQTQAAAQQQQQQPAQQQQQQRQQTQQQPAQQQPAQQQQKQAQQQNQGQQQRAETAADPIVADTRPPADLDTPTLRKRMQALRAQVQSGNLKGAERKAVNDRFKADQAEMRKRRDGGGQQQATQKDGGAKQQQTAQQPAARNNASELLADRKPAAQLSDQELRKRVNDSRATLADKNLNANQQKELRKRLADDREELRGRVARNEQTANTGNETTQGNEVNTAIVNQGGVVNNTTTINNNVTNVTQIVQQQTPSEKLNERELNQRARVLRRELDGKRLSRTEVEIANRILIEDRRVLRDRYMRDRTRRQAELRRMRDRNELRIGISVGYVPPPIIAAAEVDYMAIQNQLVAPPRAMPPRRYTYEQIAADDEVRMTMPGIDIDTINFEFGSAEVSPEEIEKLDRVGEALEKIVAARPDEVFVLEGHTDAVGTDAANLELSKRRAESVKAALTEYFLIEPSNLRTVGLGERYLKIPTEDPEVENRRVTVRRITPLLTGEAG